MYKFNRLVFNLSKTNVNVTNYNRFSTEVKANLLKGTFPFFFSSNFGSYKMFKLRFVNSKILSSLNKRYFLKYRVFKKRLKFRVFFNSAKRVSSLITKRSFFSRFLIRSYLKRCRPNKVKESFYKSYNLVHLSKSKRKIKLLKRNYLGRARNRFNFLGLEKLIPYTFGLKPLLTRIRNIF